MSGVHSIAGSRALRRVDAPREKAPDDLLSRVARGDAAATRECVDAFGPLLWPLVRRGSTCEADAEDALQEIFLDLWKSAGRYDPSLASPATFAVMIARRRLIDRRRARQRRPKLVEEDSAPPPAATTTGADVSVEAHLARRAMDALRPEQRQVLELSLEGDLTYGEISESTGMPLGTVKAHARRALLKLRALLRGTDDQKEDEGVA